MSARDTKHQSIDFYNQQAESFVSATLHADMRAQYEPFLALLPPGARILDAGCGSGRDSLYFLRHGYQVTAVDGSEAMVRHTSDLTGQPALLMKFEEIDFVETFDAIWASASLLHVPKSEIDNIIERLARALVPGGVFYLSFKYGEAERFASDRLFSDYTEVSFAELLKKHPALAEIEVRKTPDVRPGLENEYWLNIFLRKTRR